MDWSQLLVLTLPVVMGGLVAALGPVVSKRIEARNAKRISDTDASLKFRDQLMQRIDDLELDLGEIREAERQCRARERQMSAEIDQLQLEVLELKQRMREGREDGNLGRAGGSTS